MKGHMHCQAALQVTILGLILMGIALLCGCAAPAAQMGAAAQATPTAVSATGQELARLGCVCHIQGEKGAPSVAGFSGLSDDTIKRAVRQGPGVMPAWSQDNLSDEWLADISAALKSGQLGTPSPATSHP